MSKRQIIMQMTRMRKEEADKARERFLKLELEMQRAKHEYESLEAKAEQANQILLRFMSEDDFDEDEIANI